MRRVEMTDGEYGVLERCAALTGTTEAEAVVIAIRLYEQAMKDTVGDFDEFEAIPPELYPTPETTHQEALAIERQWVQDNGLVSLNEASRILECTRPTMTKWSVLGYLNEIVIYRSIDRRGFSAAHWYSGKNLWQISDMRRRRGLVSMPRHQRIMLKVQQVMYIQQARRNIAALEKEK